MTELSEGWTWERVEEVCEGFARVWEPHIRPKDEIEALAIVMSYSGVQGRPGKNLWQAALAYDYLREMHGSVKKVAEVSGISTSSAYSYLHLLELPASIKMRLA